MKALLRIMCISLVLFVAASEVLAAPPVPTCRGCQKEQRAHCRDSCSDRKGRARYSCVRECKKESCRKLCEPRSVGDEGEPKDEVAKKTANMKDELCDVCLQRQREICKSTCGPGRKRAERKCHQECLSEGCASSCGADQEEPGFKKRNKRNKRKASGACRRCERKSKRECQVSCRNSSSDQPGELERELNRFGCARACVKSTCSAECTEQSGL